MRNWCSHLNVKVTFMDPIFEPIFDFTENQMGFPCIYQLPPFNAVVVSFSKPQTPREEMLRQDPVRLVHSLIAFRKWTWIRKFRECSINFSAVRYLLDLHNALLRCNGPTTQPSPSVYTWGLRPFYFNNQTVLAFTRQIRDGTLYLMRMNQCVLKPFSRRHLHRILHPAPMANV